MTICYAAETAGREIAGTAIMTTTGKIEEEEKAGVVEVSLTPETGVAGRRVPGWSWLLRALWISEIGVWEVAARVHEHLVLMCIIDSCQVLEMNGDCR